jgi:hypothetical protein
VSFDLMVLLPVCDSSLAAEAEAFLTRHGRPARCHVEPDGEGGTIEFQFDGEEDVLGFGVSPLEADAYDPEEAPRARRAQLKACRYEAVISSSAGRSAEALECQALTAVALMHAGKGVICDPQESYTELPGLKAPKASDASGGAIYDVDFGVRWAKALGQASAAGDARKPAAAVPVEAPPPPASVRARWEESWRRQWGRETLDYFEKLVREKADNGTHEISYPVYILAYDFDHPLGRAYAKRLRQVYGGYIRDEIWNRPQPLARNEKQALWAANHCKSELYRALAYAAICDDGAWDPALLGDAAAAYEWIAYSGGWDVVQQWYAHSAALLYLLAGDVPAACRVLGGKKKWNPTQRFHDKLHAVARGLAESGALAPGSPGALALHDLFSRLRSPEANVGGLAYGEQALNDTDLRRFELAILNDRYLLGHAGVPDWRRVFTSISR